MTTFTIIDVEGRWVVNPHAFPFVDSETKLRYEPGHPMKVACPKDSWLAGQMASGVIKPAPDPTKTPPKGAATPASAPTGSA